VFLRDNVVVVADDDFTRDGDGGTDIVFVFDVTCCVSYVVGLVL
jgi:hypothetical protein